MSLIILSSNDILYFSSENIHSIVHCFIHLTQSFSTVALLTFGQDNALLCTKGCLAAFLASTHLDAHSSSPRNCKKHNVSKCCWMSLGVQNPPHLRILYITLWVFSLIALIIIKDSMWGICYIFFTHGFLLAVSSIVYIYYHPKQQNNESLWIFSQVSDYLVWINS